MRTAYRQRSIAILLALLLGHASLTFHVTTHIPVDQTSCDYCAGQANPAHAVAHSLPALPPAAADELVAPAAAAFDYSKPLFAYRQRAPPTPV